MPSDGSNPAQLFLYIPALVMGAYFLLELFRLWRVRRSPEQTAEAEVLGKRISRQRYLSNKVRFPREPQYNHYITFRIKDRCEEMLVSEEEFEKLEESCRGSLTCKGNEYIRFTPDTERRNHEKTL